MFAFVPPDNVDLCRSDLFGHKKGSFTGAIADRPGLLEHANKGTLFLDDIDAMPWEVQRLFLTFLDTEGFSRMGEDNIVRRSDVRVIAASHEDMDDLVRKKSFRDDLWARLGTKTITVPPLRERKEDIPFWAEILLEALLKNERECSITPAAMERLMEQSWLKNLRGLRQVLEVSLALKPEGDLDADDLEFD
jgi:DNA-binding NtrC family response regulator